MKQILHDLRTGRVRVDEIPCPTVTRGHLLVRTRATLVSTGTERSLVDFGRASLFQKVRQQPERAKEVIDKAKSDGLLAAISSVRARLDQTIPLGYCNAGQVVQVGEGETQGFVVGDRVLCNGPHAEVVRVPKNLCARIPTGVSDEEAAFAIPGAVALQGIRLAQPSLGEALVVTGLGLVGLLAIQILKIHGCKVLGIDPDPWRVSLARELGVEALELREDPVTAAVAFSRGRGVDGVLITAATQSSGPVRQAARMCRKRGRIVLVGVTGLKLNRAPFYEKELSFQVSCSYGPGRYDREYEERGHDYPFAYVRWTAARNFEAVLDLLASGQLDVKPLISHRFPIEAAEKAYDLISGDQEPFLGIVLKYDKNTPESLRRGSELIRTVNLRQHIKEETSHSALSCFRSSVPKIRPTVGVIGAGNFTRHQLLPVLKTENPRLKVIVSSMGVNAAVLARTFGFEQATTDPSQVMCDPDINTVFITTRHDTHVRFVCEALSKGKHVFSEKPLCLNEEELEEIKRVYSERAEDKGQTFRGPILMVGFNRRFAPHIVKMKTLLSQIQQPKCVVIRVNAGAIPRNHWTQDPRVGGGRIIGEACHFIDLLRFLIGRPVTKFLAASARSVVRSETPPDTASFTLSFTDGSIGTVHYFANGYRSLPKESVEVFIGGKLLILDNFRTLKGYGWTGFRRMSLWRQNKGHRAAVAAFLRAATQGESSPISFEELVEVMQVTFGVARECAVED
ncbi:bi-domain-containing oxidoreductase [Acidobacteria bacterium AH-259-L09]|nr:bi-domain-containing oxidoreductase [Acidobacteria bacterium AH-259-L09]